MADPADLVREACTLLAKYLPQLEEEIAEPSAAGTASGVTGRAAAAPLPGNPEAIYALTSILEGVRRTENTILYQQNGHPGRRRGMSPGNTGKCLAALPKLAAGLDEDGEAAVARRLDKLADLARRIRAIDEAQLWRPVPQRPCPYCRCFFLRVQIDAAGQPAGRVACFGHLPSGGPCRAAWATLAEIAHDLERAETVEG